MRKLLLAAAAIGGLTAVTTLGAAAATPAMAVHETRVQPLVTRVDYNWHHHQWHHRHWEHHHWRYFD
jgi:hypothetical protein